MNKQQIIFATRLAPFVNSRYGFFRTLRMEIAVSQCILRMPIYTWLASMVTFIGNGIGTRIGKRKNNSADR